MRWLRGLFVVYLAAVLTLTMWPQLEDTSVPGWADATIEALARVGIHVDVTFLEAASNLVMFLPFGVLGLVLVAHARRSWGAGTLVLAVAGAGFALSTLIETTQLAIPGRVSTLQDVALNTGGALVGAAAAEAVRSALRRRVVPPSGRPDDEVPT
ncbi:VanZ family protein [Xylanimonas ulmi]|uniref:Glycopeptide antibiotics resistance protein n=1 Tax=Xylanimonas ulmi TaxID=228973 RepID=A0A4Q7M6N3_9MICO|nr:VanZ family protein [Xylanibacterium ulmi]RZS62743.1 glycopeptide antibiotics resistance protein [Xylanibacterium ulmi]